MSDPNAADPDDGSASPNRALIATLVAVGLILLFLLIGWLTWWSDDDESETLGTADVVTASTIPGASTIPDGSIVDGSTVPTIEVTVPPETTAPTTTTPPTTAPPTTAPPTTTPPETTSPPATTTPPDGGAPDITVPPGGGSLVEIFTGNPDLSIVWSLVEAAGLDVVLEGAPGPYTIFAPTNDAFDGVTPPTGIDLQNLIGLHVVPDQSLDSAAVLAETSLPTLFGETLAVDAAAGTVGGANVLVVDLEGTEAPVGYVHVVDAILTAG